jgi:glutamine amidotransferase
MCRLFLSYNNNNITNDLSKFIDTATILDHCTDGYGIFWRKNNVMYSHIYQSAFTTDSNYDKIIRKIDGSSIVWSHVRRKTSPISPAQVFNTQPFKYKNLIFMHNGEIIDYLKHMSVIFNEIDSELKNKIKGQTDSELLMFLYMTYLNRFDNNLKLSLEKMFSFLNKNKITAVLNIISSFNNNIIICRYTLGSSKTNPTLFIEKKEDSFLVTTQRLNNKQKIIPRNTILCLR